ncbi:hypothetical protein FRC06_000778 [Ceratobasidium sp. 370]|nr:hypothetical protein FRC06_000778 [Ceratobasidium sp. 370]
MLVHKMLVQGGYEEQNIRILCDYVGGFMELADPIRQQILDSLEWLTSNTQPGDHRFFYFSGYGERIIQEQDASRARCVRIHGTGYASEGTMKQEISEMHLAYYPEAIITRYRELRPGEPRDRCSKVMDYELNRYWSNLPSGSILTCIMDCRIGGRNTKPVMPVKPRGVGRRSGGTVPMVRDPSGALEDAPASPTQEEEPKTPPTPGHDSAEVVPWDAPNTSTLTSLTNTSKTWMPNGIPVRRRQTSHIQATMVFMDILNLDSTALSAGSITYEALFRRISEELAAQHSAKIDPQLFQLWISGGGQLTGLPVTI